MHSEQLFDKLIYGMWSVFTKLKVSSILEWKVSQLFALEPRQRPREIWNHNMYKMYNLLYICMLYEQWPNLWTKQFLSWQLADFYIPFFFLIVTKFYLKAKECHVCFCYMWLIYNSKWNWKTAMNKLTPVNKPYKGSAQKPIGRVFFSMWKSFLWIDLRFSGVNWPFDPYLYLWLWHWTLQHAICIYFFTFASFCEIIPSLNFPCLHGTRHTPLKLMIALTPFFPSFFRLSSVRFIGIFSLFCWLFIVMHIL